MLACFDGIKDKYLNRLQPSEVRVTVDQASRATIRLADLPGGSFAAVIDTNADVTLRSPGGHAIKA